MKLSSHATLLFQVLLAVPSPLPATSQPIPRPTPPRFQITWPPDGAPICVAPNDQREARMVGRGPGSAIAVWVDERSGTDKDLYSQAIWANGRVGWDYRQLQGMPVCIAPGSQSSPVLTSDYAGGAVIAWLDTREDSTRGDVYAQRILSSGWIALVVWADQRNGIDWDIYAQAVTAGGVVAPSYCIYCDYVQRVFPNPGRGRFSIQLLRYEDSAVVGVYNVQGRLLRSLSFGGLSPGLN